MRTCVIFNPAAKGDKARRFRRHLDNIGGCTLKLTAAAGDARRLATEAVAEGFEIVAAAGGDGTVNEVLNGICDAPDGLQRARLGVLPLGTVNVFARELRIPTSLEAAWKTLVQGRETVIDLPCVEFTAAGGAPAKRRFVQLAGAGLDARAVELVQWQLKKKVGPLAYVLAGLHALSRPGTKITVTEPNRSATGELVLIGNGRLFGGPFRVFPQADMRDGLLEICIFPRVTWLTLVWCAPPLLLLHKLPSGAVQRQRAAAFTMSSPALTPVELDGEAVGHLAAAFTMQPDALRVIVP